MYLVGLYIYYKNDTRTLQCQVKNNSIFQFIVNTFSEVPNRIKFYFLILKEDNDEKKIRRRGRRRRNRRRGRKKVKELQCTPPTNFNFLLTCSPFYTVFSRSFYNALRTADSSKEKTPLQCLQMMHFPFFLSLFKSGRYRSCNDPFC